MRLFKLPKMIYKQLPVLIIQLRLHPESHKRNLIFYYLLKSVHNWTNIMYTLIPFQTYYKLPFWML